MFRPKYDFTRLLDSSFQHIARPEAQKQLCRLLTELNYLPLFVLATGLLASVCDLAIVLFFGRHLNHVLLVILTSLSLLVVGFLAGVFSTWRAIVFIGKRYDALVAQNVVLSMDVWLFGAIGLEAREAGLSVDNKTLAVLLGSQYTYLKGWLEEDNRTYMSYWQVFFASDYAKQLLSEASTR